MTCAIKLCNIEGQGKKAYPGNEGEVPGLNSFKITFMNSRSWGWVRQ
jgi:hypothetical protein